MAAKKGSCLKRITIGCGGLIGLMVLVILIVGASFLANRPGEMDLIHKETQDRLPQLQGTDKPVRLTLDLEVLARFDLVAGPHGELAISGDYDQNNFELETRIEEKEDHLAYHVSFKSKQNPWVYNAIITGVRYENRLRLQIPVGRCYDLVVAAQTGAYNLDLSGLAVRSIDLTCTKGELSVSMKEPNPVAMEEMTLLAKIGAATINDLQNYRFTRAAFQGRYSNLSLNSSGDFEADEIAMALAMRFGEVRLQLPESADLTYADPATFGQALQPKPAGGKTKINLSGGVSFGNFSAVLSSEDNGQGPHSNTN